MAYYQPPYQAPPPQPYYPPPPPQQMQQPYGAPTVDQFRADYANRLSQLTVNSRPIIQDLSMIAMSERDRRDWARMNVVVQEIEAAVQRARPDAKLPLIYLVDSISKNVGAPYTTQLLPYIIPRMFLTAYREVDGVTRAKMEEMVGLWRHAGPDGGDLYGREVRDAVERGIFGSAGQPGLRGSFPTREMVLQKCHATLELKNREYQARQWDTTLGRNVETLRRISGMVSNTPLQPQQLQEIMETLQGMTPSQQPPMPPPPPQYQAPPSYYTAPIQQQQIPPPPHAAPPSNIPPMLSLPPFPPQLPRDQYGTPLAPTMRSPHIPPPTPPYPAASTPQPQAPTPQPAPASVIPVDIAALLRNINSGTISSAPRTPESDTIRLDKPTSSMAKYEEMILSLDMRLELLDMNTMTSLPTAHLPQRCTQCGLRFSDTEGVMQAHLDWHFRRNRKQRESEGRGAHRRWLPRAEEWIQQSIIPEAGPSTAPEKSSKLTAERIAQLKKKRVKVPSDPDVAARPCPICKEPFKAEWSEEDEEWVWHNAMDINKAGDKPQIYHATCRAEQMNARVANRLLKDGERMTGSKSPRLTPGIDVKTEAKDQGRERTPMSTGKGKRKAESEESDAKRVKVEPRDESGEAPAAEQKQDTALDGPETGVMVVDPNTETSPAIPQLADQPAESHQSSPIAVPADPNSSRLDTANEPQQSIAASETGPPADIDPNTSSETVVDDAQGVGKEDKEEEES